MVSKYGKNISRFYIYVFFWNLCFFVPIMILFYQSFGLSMTQIMFLESIFAISIVVFQMPTGIFADKVGRKLRACPSSI